MTNANNKVRKPVAMGVAAAIALSGAFALATTAPASAAPLSISQTAVKEAAPDNVIDVRRRHRHYGGHAVAGLALGIIGTALAHKYYRDQYRHRHYYHGGYYPHYGHGYGYGCNRVHNHRSSVVSWRCR